MIFAFMSVYWFSCLFYLLVDWLSGPTKLDVIIVVDFPSNVNAVYGRIIHKKIPVIPSLCTSLSIYFANFLTYMSFF